MEKIESSTNLDNYINRILFNIFSHGGQGLLGSVWKKVSYLHTSVNVKKKILVFRKRSQQVSKNMEN